MNWPRENKDELIISNNFTENSDSDPLLFIVFYNFEWIVLSLNYWTAHDKERKENKH